MNKTVRPAQLSDVDAIMSMCDHSRSIMRSNGNTTQWVNGYPSRQQIILDIEQQHGFLVVDSAVPVGYFAFIVGADPTYAVIEEGCWLDDDTPYGTIHRMACAPGSNGVAHCGIDWCKRQAVSLRADTHADNHIVQHILESEGFTYCGIIHIADGTPRRAYQLMRYPEVDALLRAYVESEILPRYAAFDAAHRRDHVLMVIAQSMALASYYPQLDKDMVYAIAAYHDTGLCEGRERHHIVSGEIMRSDEHLKDWFDEQQIAIMTEAVEDHRASGGHDPHSLYGMIVAEADRNIEPVTIVRRTVQYGIQHYPQLELEGHWQRTLQHLQEKYSPTGYLKLYIPQSRNRQQLERLWQLIADLPRLRCLFEEIYFEIFPT